MNPNAACTVATVIFAIALPAAPRPRNDEPLAVVLARIPEKARPKRNPMEHDPEAVAAGKKLFEQHCAECHGGTAEGSKRGPSLRDGTRQATPGELFWILTNGIVAHGMPAWSKLPDEQRWQIVTFLRGIDRTSSDRGQQPICASSRLSHWKPQFRFLQPRYSTNGSAWGSGYPSGFTRSDPASLCSHQPHAVII